MGRFHSLYYNASHFLPNLHELGQIDSKQLCECGADGSTRRGNISSWEKLCHNSGSFHNPVSLMFLNLKRSSSICWNQSSRCAWCDGFSSLIRVSWWQTFPKLDLSQQRDLWKFCTQTIIIGVFLCGWSQSKDRDSHGKHKTWQAWALNL